MSYNFTIQQQQIFGTYGEFAVSLGSNQITAKYLLTKIKPGNSGSWENHLASQMAPWREIFQIEELSFDELIQRDLDDSRVAHDLIPYLLGETGHHARFFPPILAVMVPKKEQGSGIAPRYPKIDSADEKISFGDLFSFEQVKIGGENSPLGLIKYNAQKMAMVIVDGQHRAMAVLALHRQLNASWQGNPFAPYYEHIDVTAENVAHIELPVCLIYFPEINEENSALVNAGIDLISVSREIFTVVNKSAKSVGKARELLLNDDDYAAFMMRRTLTKLKEQNKTDSNCSRIYSFAFGDEEKSDGNQSMSGRLEYCSAVALYKMHAATGFGMPAAFKLINTQDITSGNYIRNSTRPALLIRGESNLASINSLSRTKAKAHVPSVTSEIVEKIGDLTDEIIFRLFDTFRPYVAHNIAMRGLLDKLNDAVARADLVQNKCKSLLFDGSGVRSVFEQHLDRLKNRKEDLSENSLPIPSVLSLQIDYCESVNRAIEKHEDSVKLNRAFILFGIDQSGFQSRDSSDVERDTKIIRTLSKSIFDTVSTQAFQIGYLMAALTAIECLNYADSTYKIRLKNTMFISELFTEGLNSFFKIGNTRHKTVTGFSSESRAKIFSINETGFRGLLQAGNVRELNESRWDFFRYVILEIIHSERVFSEVNAVLDNPKHATEAKRYREILPNLITDLFELRAKYTSAAVNTALESEDFKRILFEAQTRANEQQISDEDTRLILEKLKDDKKSEIQNVCKQHIVASLGKFESKDAIINRFGAMP